MRTLYFRIQKSLFSLFSSMERRHSKTGMLEIVYTDHEIWPLFGKNKGATGYILFDHIEILCNYFNVNDDLNGL